MKHWRCILASMAIAIGIAGCSSGPVRRVSEPAASIQQLTVRPDGGWSVDLRLQNYSSIPMAFGAVNLTVTLQGEAAGTIQGDAGISIGPESADVITIAHAPTSAARIALADAFSNHRGVRYTLEGTMKAQPEDKKQRTFDIERVDNTLNPVPGLPGVMR